MEIVIAMIVGCALGYQSAKRSWQVLPLVLTVLWVAVMGLVVSKMTAPYAVDFDTTVALALSGLTAYVFSMLLSRVGLTGAARSV